MRENRKWLVGSILVGFALGMLFILWETAGEVDSEQLRRAFLIVLSVLCLTGILTVSVISTDIAVESRVKASVRWVGYTGLMVLSSYAPLLIYRVTSGIVSLHS